MLTTSYVSLANGSGGSGGSRMGSSSALPVLPLLLLGFGFGLDLWGSSGEVFCPGPSVGVVGHHHQRYVSDSSAIQ